MSQGRKAFVQAAMNFCSTTSLHGWSFLTNETSIIGKCYWILALIGGSSLALCCLTINYIEYVSRPPSYYIESTTAPLHEIPFPTVSFTNINQVQKSFWAQLNASDEHWNLLLGEYVLGRAHDLQAEEEDLIKTYENKIDAIFNWTAEKSFFEITSMECKDMIIYARFASYPEKVFFDSSFYQNDWGKKCTIQPYLDFIHPGTKNRKTHHLDGKAWFLADELGIGHAKSAIYNGLTFLLDIEEFEYGERRLGSMGLFFTINTATSSVKISEKAIILQNGHETQIAINPRVTTTTQDAISFYEPHLRDCYTSDEFELKFLAKESGYDYTTTNCISEGIVETTMELCNCFPEFGWSAFKVQEGKERCVGKGIHCANQILFGLTHNESMNQPMDRYGNRRKCQSNCHEIDFKIDGQSQGHYPSKNTFFLKSDSCYVFQKIVRVCRHPWKRLSFQEKYNQVTCKEVISLHENGPRLCQNLTHFGSKTAKDYPEMYDLIIKYTKNNIVHVKVFISDPYYTKIVRDVRYSFISFIGNTGGLMSLCIGMSFISLLEIIFFCLCSTQRIMCP